MRPVAKGACPYSSLSRYQDARGFLIERLGELCSYCEMHLDSGLAVEHVQPKSRQPQKSREWENLLLACANCNATKGKTPITDATEDEYLWPDRNNTFLALEYSEGGVVSANEQLPPSIQEKARRLIHLVGLDKTPDRSSDQTDRRWQNRIDAWGLAQRSKDRLARVNTQEMRAQIVDEAKDYFSIWMTVFAEDADMKRRFIEKFKGTAPDCFDASQGYAPVHRPDAEI